MHDLLGYIDKNPRLKEVYDFSQRMCTPEKWEHTLHVCEFGVEEILGYSHCLCEKFIVSGLMHDIFKDQETWNNREKIREFQKCYSGYNLSEMVTPLFHGYLAAEEYSSKFQFQFDEDIYNTILYHSSGRKNMCALEQVLFVSDAGNRQRTFPEVNEIREKLNESLIRAVNKVYQIKISYILKKGDILHPITIDGYNWSLCEFKE